jgi:hypothetical protein
MSAFPLSADPSPRTAIRADTGKRSTLTMGGGLRGRNSFDQTYYDISRVDQDISAADVASVWAHHDGAPDDTHTMTIDSVPYNFQYVTRPQIIEYHGDRRTLQTVVRGWA